MAIVGGFNPAKGICRVVHIHQGFYGVRWMNDEDLLKAVLNRVHESDGKRRLNCAEAFELARELRVDVSEIGRICNRQKIRISNCQLGCFP